VLKRLPRAYLAAILLVAATRALAGRPTTSALALTPDRLAAGKIWLLPTSGVIVDGPVLPQLAGVVPAVLVAERRLGGTFTGAVMVIAHVGATLLTYGTLAVFTGDADGAHNRSLDYGISAVWLGTLGALFTDALPAARRREPRALVVTGVGAAAFITGVSLFPLLAATEHGFAFAIGALATGARAVARRSARSAASTGSARAALASAESSVLRRSGRRRGLR
jgi:hypothetical protein